MRRLKDECDLMGRLQPITLVAVGVSFLVLVPIFNRFINNLFSPPIPIATVTIPEGATVREINEELARKGVLVGASLPASAEGYLFPDTYEFFVPSKLEVVQKKFQDNFERKVGSALSPNTSEDDLRRLLTLASLVEKEVPDSYDRKVVTGVLIKRLENNLPLQVDASICYIKNNPQCLPIKSEDKKLQSPYNTYLYRGLPPQPINNPGLDAITAALHPESSPYWFYLSEPKNDKTIFAKTLDEHQKNIIKYLKTK